ncbi:MAG: hypothetical protein MZV64_27035 [Ignavibacteriales bacterium]|nr:hypothetical protein [Ignavibacteriales bacterium]
MFYVNNGMNYSNLYQNTFDRGFKSIDTNDLLNVIKFSDTGKDKSISKDELLTTKDKLYQQLNSYIYLKTAMPYSSYMIDQHISKLTGLTQAVNFITHEFNAFSKKGNKEFIEESDLDNIIINANKDGKISDFSLSTDLKALKGGTVNMLMIL